MRGGFCRIGMATALLFTGVAHAQVTPKRNDSQVRIVTHGMTTGEFGLILARIGAMENANCGPRWYEGNSFTLEELAGAKVKRIRVLRAEAWKGAPAPKPEAVRSTVGKVWSGKFAWRACEIEWDEPTYWSIQGELEFEDGKKGVLITDGWHVALQDHDGHNWFVR